MPNPLPLVALGLLYVLPAAPHSGPAASDPALLHSRCAINDVLIPRIGLLACHHDETDPAETPKETTPPAADTPRQRLESAGYTFATDLVTDMSIMPGATAGTRNIARGLFTASLAVDLEKAAGLSGASGFVQYRWKRGPNGTTLLNASQGFSNIDADDFQQFGEVWIEQRMVRDRLRIKAGRVDGNTEFAGVDAAADFLNPSMGFTPTITQLPTYPEPAPSINLFGTIAPQTSVGVGFYGMTPGPTRWREPFSIAEVRQGWSLAADTRPGKVRVGGWHKRAAADGDSGGIYGVAEQTIWSAAGDMEKSLTAFMQWGHAAPDTCSTDRHVGGGMIWRRDDTPHGPAALGFGVTRVRFGAAAEHPGQSELALAAFARLQVHRWIAITPDVTLIRHPSGDRAAGVTPVATLRLQIGY